MLGLPAPVKSRRNLIDKVSDKWLTSLAESPLQRAASYVLREHALRDPCQCPCHPGTLAPLATAKPAENQVHSDLHASRGGGRTNAKGAAQEGQAQKS